MKTSWQISLSYNFQKMSSKRKKEFVWRIFSLTFFIIDCLPYGLTCTREKDSAKSFGLFKLFFPSHHVSQNRRQLRQANLSIILHFIDNIVDTKSVCLYTILDTHDRKSGKEVKHGSTNLFENI